MKEFEKVGVTAVKCCKRSYGFLVIFNRELKPKLLKIKLMNLGN